MYSKAVDTDLCSLLREVSGGFTIENRRIRHAGWGIEHGSALRPIAIAKTKRNKQTTLIN